MRKLLEFLKLLLHKKYIITITILVIVGLIGCGIYFLKKNSNDYLLECFLVQFDTRGGSAINSQLVVCGGKIEEPENPTKIGYNFIEWQYNNEKFDFSTYKVNSNMILTADWEVKQETEVIIVHFDTDGGNQIEDIELAKGSQLMPPLNPIKDGYEFNGWYLDNKKFDFINPINEEITLKAQWIMIEETNIITSENIVIDNNGINDMNYNSNIDNSQCKYTMKTGEYSETPSWGFGLGEETILSSYWGFWDYSQDTCKITYRTDDSTILSVSPTGVAVGKKIGTTNLYICVVNKATNEELDAFKWIANVEYIYGSQRAVTDGNNLLKAIDGYYWYLDGYTYAYIYPTVIDWYDHQALNWDSKYIELLNNKFVTTEETGTKYDYTSANIHNTFLVNPTEFAYDLISKYNMKVSKNKLYITIGGKIYSFTKHSSPKKIIPEIMIDNNSVNVDKYTSFEITLSVVPSFADYTITTSSSDSSIAYCSWVDGSNNKLILNCFALKPGNATLTVKDSNSGKSATVKVCVNNTTINVNSISLNKTNLNLLSGNTETLVATINPTNADNKNIEWFSDNTKVATVDSNGRVTAIAKGTTTITAKTSDGGYTASCLVTINNPQLIASASIGYSTVVSNSSISAGISVTLKASGGSGNYTYYYIKLYNDTGVIGETINTSSNSLFVSGYKSGNYYVEYVVKDSDGNEISGTSGKTTISM